jgi:hypothetical protein
MITWPHKMLQHKTTQHCMDLFYPGGNWFNSRVDLGIVCVQHKVEPVHWSSSDTQR